MPLEVLNGHCTLLLGNELLGFRCSNNLKAARPLLLHPLYADTCQRIVAANQVMKEKLRVKEAIDKMKATNNFENLGALL